MMGQDRPDRQALHRRDTLTLETIEPTASTGRHGIDTSKLKAQRVRLGEWLVRRALISRFSLYQALVVAFQENCRLGDALVQLGHLQRDGVEREARAMDDARAARRSEVPPS